MGQTNVLPKQVGNVGSWNNIFILARQNTHGIYLTAAGDLDSLFEMSKLS